VTQLLDKGMLTTDPHELYIDQNISAPLALRNTLAARGVTIHMNQDSRVAAGLQVADHAAHALGGMLLERMALSQKMVPAGENSGYDPQQKIELGFELWTTLRYALVGNNEVIPGLSPPPEDPANPYFRVDGYGLYIASECSNELAAHARECFGVNYLGCIH
jgi:hypothetical protein